MHAAVPMCTHTYETSIHIHIIHKDTLNMEGRIQVWWHGLVISALGKWRQGHPWGYLASQAYLVSSRQRKTLFQKTIMIAPEEWHLRLTVGLHKHVHTHVLPHLYTHTHTLSLCCQHILRFSKWRVMWLSSFIKLGNHLKLWEKCGVTM